jgi:hypothetical protein
MIPRFYRLYLLQVSVAFVGEMQRQVHFQQLHL